MDATAPREKAFLLARPEQRLLEGIARRLPARVLPDHLTALALLAAAGRDQRVLVVGHEPDFSQVVYDLSGGRVDFKKGGIAAVRVERAGGELLVLLRPRELESIAGG